MKIHNIMLPVCAAVAAFLSVSCQKEDSYDSASGNPVLKVTAIYLEDYKSDVPDRAVDFCRLGQTLRIEGEGLLGLRHVYINGYDTYFNKAYVADNSMLITVNKNTPVTDADESVRNTFVFEKDAASLVYNFTVRASSPTITGIGNWLPLAGDTVYVEGANLHEISAVNFPDGQTSTDIPEQDPDGKWFKFVMPEVSVEGPFTADGAHGRAAAPYGFNNRQCMILDFDGAGAQGFWSWKETGSMINDEDLVDDPAGTGHGKCFKVVPDRLLLPDGIPAGKTRVTECWTVGAGEEGAPDWEGFSSILGADTPVTDIAFQFDIYCPQPWDFTGQIEVCLVNNYSFNGLGDENSSNSDNRGLCGFFVPWTSGEAYSASGWTTVTIPLSEFKKYEYEISGDEPKISTFSDVVTSVREATYQNFGVGFVNADFILGGVEYTSSVFMNELYIDNWRLIPLGSEEITDFPEE